MAYDSRVRELMRPTVRGVRALMAMALACVLGLAQPATAAQTGFDEMIRDLADEGADAVRGLMPGDEPRPVRGATVIRFEGELDRGALSLLRRAVDEAAERDDALIIELDTPGGRVDLMWRLSRAIFDARDRDLRVIAWVDSEALSAGALVAMSCELLLMNTDARIGASLPIVGTPTGMAAVEEKYLSVARSGFRSVAERTKRPTALAEGMVDPSLEVLWVEVDGFAKVVDGDEWDTLRIEGMPVRKLDVIAARDRLVALTTDEALKYRLADDEVASLRELLSVHLDLPVEAVTRVEETRAEELASLLDSLAPLLLILGVTLAYIELKTPGLGVAGALAVACFVALLFGRYLVGLAGVEHFVIIALGAILIAVEVFLVPGMIWPGVTGAVLIVGGLIWSQLGRGLPLAHEFDRQLAFDAAFRTALWGAVALVLSAALSWVLPKTPVYSRFALAPTDTTPSFGSALGADREAAADRGLVGRAGVARTDLRPVGHVHLDGQGIRDYEAWSVAGALERGTRVRVVATEGGRLKVEAAPAEAGGETGSAEARA